MTGRDDIQRERFGHVRSLLHEGPGDDHDAWWQTLLALLETEATMDPETYDAIWRPYLEGFPHHWRTHVQRITTPDELARYTRLLPEALRFELHLHRPYLRGEDLHVLLDTPHTGRVVALDVHGLTSDPEGPRALLRHASNLDALRNLRLTYAGLDDACFEALTRHLPSLRRLELCENHLTTLPGLARSRWRNLRHLDLRSNPLDAQGLEALAQRPHLDALHISVDGAAAPHVSALAKAPWARNISNLRVYLTSVRLEALENTLQGLRGLRLFHLTLAHLNAYDTLGRALTTHVPGVRELALRNCRFIDHDIEHLVAAPMPTSLTISRSPFTDTCARALAASPHARALRTLSLLYNDMTREGARALLDSEHLTSLETLRVTWASQTPEERAELARTTRLGHLLA